jgi:hypothetical protein
MSTQPESQRVINRDQNAATRVTLALKLRASKVKYEEIARQCGYANAGAAHKAVKRELARTIVANVEELRHEELDSLDLLELECWKRLHDPDYKSGKLFAVDRIIAIKERRARLMGLDRPVESAANANLVVIREIPHGYLDGLLAPPPPPRSTAPEDTV